jgi:hypothetical protein
VLEARVTRAGWRRAARSFERVPTSSGSSRTTSCAAASCAGRAAGRSCDCSARRRGFGDDHFLSYFVGPQRDSFFQVDSEGLSIELDREGVVRRADFFQG